MLIGGTWVAAASGKTIESTNPSTGEAIAEFAAGEQEDVDRAVVAARGAFEGPWRTFYSYAAAERASPVRRPDRETLRGAASP